MSILEVAIGWLAPPACVGCGADGVALCAACSTSAILTFGKRCWRCNRLSPGSRTCQACSRPDSPGRVWITTNYENLAKEVIGLYKFGHLRAAAVPIAGLMSATFHTFNPAPATNYLVVPVPTATVRVRQRGFGHAELLAKAVAANLRMERANALARLGQSRQLGASRRDRLQQLSGSFVVKNPDQIAGRNILLIDDVITTGGTLLAVTKVLKTAGAARVDALVFAKKL